IRGTITDRLGNPLSGVTIVLKDTPSRGTTSDENGRYTLSVPANSVLIFSSVGHNSQEVSVGNRREINIALEDAETAMDEVVVVGYGTQKKSHLTGAVSTINIEDNLQGRAIADIGRGLQGVSPGLNVRTPSGDVG